MENIFFNTQRGRLDKILSVYAKKSRNQIEQLIISKKVKVNENIICKTSHALKGGENIEIIPYHHSEDSSAQKNMDMAHMDIEILYEDSNLLVLNKPPMLVVHPAPTVKEVTLCEWLAYKGYTLSTLNGNTRLGIVHRLDKETSGAIVVAKDNDTHQALSKQLENKSMGRYYIALIDSPLSEYRMYDCYMARNPKNRLKMSKTTEGKGKYSQSYFINMRELYTKEALIAVKLQTGRTHQIRCHLAQMGKHILGDELYGWKGKWNGRILLHALGIYFIHPRSEKKIFLKAPVFSDMLKYIQQNYYAEDLYEILQLPFIMDSFRVFRMHEPSNEN